ncbi:TRAP transporter substrate-binding protein DctP [Marasmitruncus massiliensis]|uniref:TRAP transporter substrate-binding protein DctP n=1 Tax=Marasmitruncus massiliensis TaxID=1944642 RepID=UPI0015E0B2A0|nr:TRAP transporter substrate-binding protein DctP [Marasmitruncus massiliensis]
MQKFRGAISFVTVLCMVFSFCACGNSNTTLSSSTEKSPDAGSAAASAQSGSQETTKDLSGAKYILKAGHVLSTEHPYQSGLEKLDELLNERTNGEVRVEIYPSSQLGNERDLFEGCQLGTVDLALGATAPLANFIEGFTVFDLPYLFASKDEAYKALDGEWGKNKMDTLESVDMIGLAFWECGYFDVINSNRSIKEIKDYDGLSIRVMENNVFMATMSALGINPVPMAWSEVFTSIQNGTVDGTSNPIATIYSSNIHTIAKYFTIANMIYSPTPLIMSKATYDSLPAEYQQILRDAAQEVALYERSLVSDMEDTALVEMEKAGTEIIKFDDTQIAEMKKLMQEKVWPQFIGSSVEQNDIDQIQSIIGG